MKAYMIFLGGTGARCMEALAYSLLAGCAPDGVLETIQVLSADSDDANKNLTDARDGVKAYESFRRYFCDPLHNADTPSAMAKIGLNMRKWHTHPAHVPGGNSFQISTLSEHGSDLENAGLLTDALYTKQEQNICPDEYGYVAHPNVGAAFLQACMLTTSETCDYYLFFNDLCNDLLKGETDVRLLIVGSLFGGTGASSFPALLSDVDRILFAADVGAFANHLSIGAVMVAPYFQIEKDLKTDFDVNVNSNGFDAATKQALRYYAAHYQNRFHAVYLLGANPKHGVPQQPAGGAAQANPPMLLELDVAQACLHYLSISSADLAAGNRLFYTCIEEKNGKLQHGWHELGVGGDKVAPLARMVYFSLVVHLMILPKFKDWQRSGGPDFYLKYIADYMKTQDSETGLKLLSERTADFLQWFQTMMHQEEIEQHFIDIQSFDLMLLGLFPSEDEDPNIIRINYRNAQKEFSSICNGKKKCPMLISKLDKADRIPTPVNEANLFKKLNNMEDLAVKTDQEGFSALIHAVYQYCCN